ncbi:protein yellow-like isoform X2 [Cimex lectularius]|uniref:Bee-milk protein n=1 Tax=Cimex lectularius TaxID=79782 RepID=A0A8I6SFV5_CIMLE|nr:protein yellow-like isoform X2 [Cimex lectularius]
MNCALLMFFISVCKAQKHFKEQFSWWNIDYDFPNGEEKRKFIESGAYVQGNSLISSIDKWYDKIFLAVPRLKNGVPSTLNYISTADAYTKAPNLKPYPSWDFNENTNKTLKGKKMVSVISLYVDKCSRLWALDTGIVEELKIKKSESPPSLHIFNLNDDKIIRRYVLKEEDYKWDSRFTNIVVENSHGNCEYSYAYLADSKNGLVVYNWDRNKSYQIKHNYFSFEPIWGILKTGSGRTIQVDNGIQGMALFMMDLEGYRKLFFNPMAGINEFSVSTKILQNKTWAMDSIDDFHFVGERGLNSQSSASIFDQDTGVLFYTAFTKNCIMCWNSFRLPQNIPQNLF